MSASGRDRPFNWPTWPAGNCTTCGNFAAQAVAFLLQRTAGQTHTLRAYTKELERFILWCALVACKPMSSLLVDDCEAYKNFLVAPLPEFCGPRTVKTSKRWKLNRPGFRGGRLV